MPNSPDKLPALPAGRLAFTLREFSEASRISRSKIYEMLASGELRAKKVGRRTLIPVDEVQRFFSELPNVKPEVRA